jgi:anti-sigma regulatory factor (Ser/Thr protein kinase)
MHRYDHRNTHQRLTVDLGLETSARRLTLQHSSELWELIEKLEDWMRVLSYERDDLFAVRVILFEAVNNALRHGNGNEPGKLVHVRYLVTPTEVLVEVRDQGKGFDPSALPDPRKDENVRRLHGRGVLLMRSFATWLSFNREGNQVTLCRQRTV